MKFFTSICLFLAVATTTFASNLGLSPNQECPLIDHLIEINKEWLKYDQSSIDLMQSTRFQNDEERIQLHLQLVSQILTLRDNSHLSTQQIENRTKQIDVLTAYYKAGLFPKNTGHTHRQPYFVDDFGNACAVGYLVLQDGQKDFVQKIQSENNFAYIHEMDYPELGAWARINGFTKDELAWIQPGYQPQGRPFTSVGNDGGVEGEIIVMKADENDEMLYMGGNFSAVDGVEANNIIAWDGSSWHTFGEGVVGTINAIDFYDGDLIIAGDFHLANDENAQNIAQWNGDEWIALQNGDMEGSIYDIAVFASTLYIGGDFQKINELPKRTFARYAFWQGEWKNDFSYYDSGNTINIPHAMEVNGKVTALEIVGTNILVGGDFDSTAPIVNNSNVNQVEANHLAYWGIYENNWLAGLSGDHPPVYSLAYINGDIMVGTQTVGEEKCIAILRGGLWIEENTGVNGFTAFGDNTIHGFVDIGDAVLVYGGFSYLPIVGFFGKGAAIFSSDDYFSGYASFDGIVSAVANFQDKIFFAGDFTQVNSESMNNLSQLAPITNTSEPQKEDIKIHQSGSRINVDYPPLTQDATITFYNIAGQQVGSSILPSLDRRKTMPIAQWPTGAYVYRVQIDNYFVSGKFFVKGK